MMAQSYPNVKHTWIIEDRVYYLSEISFYWVHNSLNVGGVLHLILGYQSMCLTIPTGIVWY